MAGPEAANNASAAGMFVPLLALGLPVTATAAVLLAAMQTYGIQPGPTLLADQPDLVWTLLASLLIGNTLLLVINLPLAPLWAKLLRIPRPQLYAGILFFASLGAYSVNQDPFDLALLLFFGGVGFAIRRFGIPVLPLILGRHPRAADGAEAARGARPLRRRGERPVQRGPGDLRLRARRARDRAAHRAGPAAPVPGRTRADSRQGGGQPMTVVVGYIPDQYGDAALAAGIEEAERRGTELVVVNATKGDALIDRRFVGEAGLAELEKRLETVGVAHQVRQTMGVDVADEILKAAAETDADVIVIGMRHRTPVGKLIMGSVAQQVLLEAPCWVIAVKPA